MINLFSDTVTKPTVAMREAMVAAEVGDEQRGEDPTTRRLEHEVAGLLGLPAAILVPTATMANQIALGVHCRPGAEVLCHQDSHVIHFEGGGLAANAGAQVVSLKGSHGCFSGDAVRAGLRPDHPLFARSSAVVVENTSNLGGGMVWPDDCFASVVDVCQREQLALHIDGARLFNAAIARNRDVSYWSKHADSVQLCFSKGLGCPFGAVLAGNKEFIAQARRLKQRMGGALRQSGVIAGAMLYALEHHVERLAEDHRRLRALVDKLSVLPGLQLFPHETNILYFIGRGIEPELLAERFRANGVLVSVVQRRLRLCTHLDVSDADLEFVESVFARVLSTPKEESARP